MLLNPALPVTSDDARPALLPSRAQYRLWNPDHNRRRFEDWCTAMREGESEEAWSINDREGQHWPSAHQLWNGEPLQQGTIELESRHGLGDFVQMMRFVPVLNEMGCTVSVKVRPELQALAPCFKGAFTTRALCDRPSRLHSVEIMELPYALRLHSTQLPARTSYLTLPIEVTARQRVHMGTRSGVRKIGIVWSGSSWDPERWIPFHDLRPLLNMTCVEWWSMQGGPTPSSQFHPHLRQLGGQNSGSLVDFAASIQALDLLITVDTLAAHIAGALGKEVWVLLKKQADWRWMQDRSDSPWYPSMRLFRQQEAGDWASVLTTVQSELTRRLIA